MVFVQKIDSYMRLAMFQTGGFYSCFDDIAKFVRNRDGRAGNGGTCSIEIDRQAAPRNGVLIVC